MKKLSLRMRLTLIVLIVIVVIALLLTLIAMYNAKKLNADTMATVAVYMQVDDENMVGKIIDVPDFDTEVNIESDEDLFIFPSENGISLTSDGVEMESMLLDFETMQGRFDYTSIIFMLIIIVAGGIITYFALGRGLKPVKQLSNEIEGITENELNVRITDFNAGDETSKLADSFNTLMERLEKAFSEQKNFSTSAAHELKTPLAAIKSNIDVLELDANPTSEEYAQTISVIKKQTDRMSNLVDDLFAFSSGDYDTDDTVNITETIESVVADFSHAIQNKNLDVQVDSKVTALLKTNQSMLLRILTNLIGNAINYTELNGKICVETSEDNTGFTIKIADDGMGIPPEYTDKIFQPFFRIDASRSRKAGGAGLGLAIANSMAEKIGGTISVSENTPKGSIFTLRIVK